MTRLSSPLVFDGLGGPPFAGTVAVRGSEIEDLARGSEAGEPGSGPTLELDGMAILPGLIDAHSHLGLVALPPAAPSPTAVVAAQIFENCGLALEDGFTTLRDLGGLDGGVVEAIRRGLVAGPRILPSGPLISQTGGHADFRPPFSHAAWGGNLPCLTQPAALVDGEAELRRAGRSALRDGASQLKAAVSGGFSSDYDLFEGVQFDLGELRALVEVARASHTYVTAHAHHSAAVRLGLEAGVECFEHGTFLDQETVERMRVGGANLVATLSVVKPLADPEGRRGLRADLQETAARAFSAMSRSVSMAVAAGMTVGSGSDQVGPHQRARGTEVAVRALVTSPAEAIVAATSANARILRLEGETGSLRSGLASDLTVVDGDPLREPEIFADSGRVRLVLRAGRICKNTLPGSLAEAARAAFSGAEEG